MKVRSALKWSIVEAVINTAAAMVVIFYVARIIGPAAFGVASIVIVFCSIGEALVSTPFMEAIVQKKELEPDLADTLFSAMTVGGLGVYFCMLLALYFYGASSGNPQIVYLGAVQGISIVLTGVRGCQEALLSRNLLFQSLATRTVSAKLVSTVVTVGLAHFDFGTWSLIVGNVMFSAIATFLVLLLSDPRRFNFQFMRLSSMLAFSMWNMLDVLLTVLTPRLFGYLVAWRFGTESFGQLSLAFRICDSLVALMASVITRIALPILSRNANHNASLVALWSRGTRAATFVAIPSFVGLSIVSVQTIEIFLGQEWRLSSSALSIISLYYMFNFMSILVQPTMKALGRTWVLSFMHLLTLAVIVAMFFVLSGSGFLWAVAAYSIGGLFYFLFGAAIVFQTIRFNVANEFLFNLKVAGSVALMVVSIEYFAGMSVAATSAGILVSKVLVGCVAYGLATVLFFSKDSLSLWRAAMASRRKH